MIELPVRVEWSLFLMLLSRKKITLKEVSSQLGIPSSTAQNYKNKGCEPPYSIGSKLINLFAEHLDDDERIRCGIAPA